MSEGTSKTRSAVKTYVPEEQKEIWQAHAEEFDMSQSEFVRMMVQAGRRYYTEDGPPTEKPNNETNPSDDQPRLTLQVQKLLTDHDSLTWEELLAKLTDDFEMKLEESLNELQESNEVMYNGRKGGYVLDDS